MAYSASLSRDEFLSWLGGTFAPEGARSYLIHVDRSDARVATLVWDEKPSSTSIKGREYPVIAVPRLNIREFYSFVGTYVSTFFPFSAFFRVVPAEEISKLLDGPALQKRGTIHREYLIGPIIAEARVQAGKSARSLSELSIQACLATMSTAAASILIAGWPPYALETGCEHWLRSRRLLSDEPLSLDGQLIVEFWSTLAAVFEEMPLSRMAADDASRKIVQFVSEVLTSPPDVDPELWGRLTEGLNRSRSALRIMRDSREERVRALDDVTREIATNESVDRRIRAVVAGYLASRVAGGSFAYLQLLNPFEGTLPLAALWFGFFSALRSDSDVLTVAECLGRRVRRDIEKPSTLFSPPTADISMEELEVMLTSGGSIAKVRTEHQNSIIVEIFPTINAVFRLPRSAGHDAGTEPSAIQRELFGEIRYLTQRLMRTVDGLYDPRQQSLFPDNPRSRYASRPRKGDK